MFAKKHQIIVQNCIAIVVTVQHAAQFGSTCVRTGCTPEHRPDRNGAAPTETVQAPTEEVT